LAEHQPDLLAQTAAVLLPKDYVRLRMTDAVCTEPSDAAATWLFDVKTGDWSDALLGFCGLERRYLPEIVPSTNIAGKLTSDAAQALGLPAGIPVVAGCADQPAQSLGYGLYKPGFALATIATGGQFVMPIAAPQTDDQMRFHLFNHAVPNIWYAQGATLCAGLSLRWLRDVLGFADRPNAYEHLSTLAAAVPAGADGLLFLPYLAGERTPLMDAEASGVFVGLRIHHTPGHLARAVMEGVAFSPKECLDLVFATATDNMGADVDVIASGGAARSPVWRQIQADIYNRSLLLSVGANHAPVGAALLAGIGAGIYASFDEACSLLPQPTERIVPDAARAAFYAERSTIFRSMYSLLKDDMHRLTRAVPPTN
ncbi:MAG: xylulokinase, partial [Burkholderiales bacterium]|nr:xylulokinase [Anaerolineae bacterium]